MYFNTYEHEVFEGMDGKPSVKSVRVKRPWAMQKKHQWTEPCEDIRQGVIVVEGPLMRLEENQHSAWNENCPTGESHLAEELASP